MARGSPSSVLPIDAATISPEPIGTVVEDTEVEVTKRCRACLQALRRALPPLSDENGAMGHGLRAVDMGDSDLLGNTIEKCAMALVSIVRDCPVAHTAWPLETEARRPCCCDIVSRTRREIEEELRARYGDRGILPRGVDDRSGLPVKGFTGREVDADASEQRVKSCPAPVGSCNPPSPSGGDESVARLLSPVVCGQAALSNSGQCDGLPRELERRFSDAAGSTVDAASAEVAVEGDGLGKAHVVDDGRGVVDGAWMAVKSEEVEAVPRTGTFKAKDIGTDAPKRCEMVGEGKERSNIADRDETSKQEMVHDGTDNGLLPSSSNGVPYTGTTSPRTYGDGAAVLWGEARSEGVKETGGGRGIAGSDRMDEYRLTEDTEQVSNISSSNERGHHKTPAVAPLDVPTSGEDIWRYKSEAASGVGNGQASRPGVRGEDAVAHFSSKNCRLSGGGLHGDGNPKNLESQSKQPRCHQEGCPETPIHGLEGERPLWCQMHYIAQERRRPLRCPVLKANAKGDLKACLRETTWAWRRKPPTRCTLHKTPGMVDTVEFFSERFYKVVWANLLKMGWRIEKSHRSRYRWWMPPNVFRGTTKFRSRVDYFDTKSQVIKHCLRSDMYYGFMLEELLKRSSGYSGANAAVAAERSVNKKVASGACNLSSSAICSSSPRSRDASRSGKISTSSAGKTVAPRAEASAPGASFNAHPINDEHHNTQTRQHQQRPHQQQSRRRKRQEESPPKKSNPAATPTAFTHQLFSLKPPVKRKDGVVSGADSAAKAVTLETKSDSKSARVRQGDKRRREYRWQLAAKLRGLGHDPALVTKIGLAHSIQRVRGFVERIGPCRDSGDPLAALVASIGGFSELRSRAEENSERRSSPADGEAGCGGIDNGDVAAGDAGLGDTSEDKALRNNVSESRAEEGLEELSEDAVSSVSTRNLPLPDSSPGRGEEREYSTAPLAPAARDTEPECEIHSMDVGVSLRPDGRVVDFSREKGSSGVGRILRDASSVATIEGRENKGVCCETKVTKIDNRERLGCRQSCKRKPACLDES